MLPTGRRSGPPTHGFLAIAVEYPVNPTVERDCNARRAGMTTSKCPLHKDLPVPIVIIRTLATWITPRPPMSAPSARPAVDPRMLRILCFEDLHVGMRETLMK